MLTSVGNTNYKTGRVIGSISNQMVTIAIGNSITAQSQYNAGGTSATNLTAEVHLANMLSADVGSLPAMQFKRITATTRMDRNGIYGYSGAPLSTILPDLEAQVYTPLANAQIVPDLVIGHALLENDITADATVASMKLSITAFVRDINARYPGALIILATPRPSFSNNTASRVLAYQQMRDFILSLHDGATIFACRTDNYENSASPGTPQGTTVAPIWTDALVHPNAKGSLSLARNFAATLRLIGTVWKTLYRLISNNMALTGSISAATTNVTGTAPTLFQVGPQSFNTIVCTAENPGLLMAVTSPLKASAPPYSEQQASFSAFAIPAADEISPYVQIQIISGAANLICMELRPQCYDASGNWLQAYINYVTGDVDPDYQDGDILTLQSLPLTPVSGSINQIYNWFFPIMKIAGGTTTFRVLAQGVGIVKESLRTNNKKGAFVTASVNLNNVADTLVTGLPAKYRLRRVTPYDASVPLTTSAAAIGVFTGPGGTGTALVPAATLTGLTAPTKLVDMALAAVAGTDYQTANPLYIRNTTAHGAPATATVLIEIDQLLITPV